MFDWTSWRSAWNWAVVKATPPATTPVVLSKTPSSSDLSPTLGMLPVPAAAREGVPEPVDLLTPRVDQVDILYYNCVNCAEEACGFILLSS